METTPQIFYRYEYTTYYNYNLMASTNIHLNKYYLKKETPAGYWIGFKNFDDKFKWIAKVGKKKFAYETKEEAFINLKLRTKRRLSILKSQLRRCESAISAIENFEINKNERMLEL